MSASSEMVEMRKRLEAKVAAAIAEFQEQSGVLVSLLAVEGVITRNVAGDSMHGGLRVKIEVELP